mmetsp:Transcript_4811/g.14497  ORF Transcript_4811/g.14497 Transcript_4811/m.14497 type:complete len:257 (-) Transcript_4811:81-851(-)
MQRGGVIAWIVAAAAVLSGAGALELDAGANRLTIFGRQVCFLQRQCESGERCHYFQCIQDTNPNPDPTCERGFGRCCSNGDCWARFECKFNVCIPEQLAASPTPTGCVASGSYCCQTADCPTWESCVDGRCRYSETCVHQVGRCCSTRECREGYLCVSGLCQLAGTSTSPLLTPTPTFTVTPTPTFGFGVTPTPTFGFGVTPTPTFGFGVTPTPSAGVDPTICLDLDDAGLLACEFPGLRSTCPRTCAIIEADSSL